MLSARGAGGDVGIKGHTRIQQQTRPLRGNNFHAVTTNRIGSAMNA